MLFEGSWCYRGFLVWQSDTKYTEITPPMQSIAIAVWSLNSVAVWAPSLACRTFSLSRCWASPVTRKELCGLKPAQGSCCLWNSFVSYVVFVRTFTPSRWSGSLGDIQFFNELGEKHLHHEWIPSTVMQSVDLLNWHSSLSKTKATGPLCAEIKSVSLQQLWSVTPRTVPELGGHIALALVYQAAFRLRGL